MSEKEQNNEIKNQAAAPDGSPGAKGAGAKPAAKKQSLKDKLAAAAGGLKSSISQGDKPKAAKQLAPAAGGARPAAGKPNRPALPQEDAKRAERAMQNSVNDAGVGVDAPGAKSDTPDAVASGRPAPAGRNGNKNAAPAKPSDDGRTRVHPGAAPTGQNGRQRVRIKRKAPVSTFILTVIGNLLKAFFVVCCIGLMAGAVVAVQVVQYVVAETQNDDNVLDIENIKLNQTSYIMALKEGLPPLADGETRNDDDYEVYQELIGEENRVWVPLDQIPQHLIDAVVAIEDREFYNHHGVNFQRTVYALLNEFFQFQDYQFGASTIDQQLVKNITGDDDVTDEGGDAMAGYQRKLREIFRAWGLNNRYTKDMIMEAYLNTMSLSERIAGVQAGAIEYFGKDVSELTIAQCATIAGITRAPGWYSPVRHPDNALKRRDDVLYQMYQEGYINQKEYNTALDAPLGIIDQTSKSDKEDQREVFSYFSDTVFNDVVNDFMKQEGLSRSEAINRLYNGGYRIYATVDTKVQSAAEDMYLNGYDEGGFWMDENRFPGYVRNMTIAEDVTRTLPDGTEQVVGTQEVLPQSACAVINYDGELVAVVGGIGPKEESLSLNRAVGTLRRDPATGQLVKDENGNYIVDGTVRQVGSTMKMTAAYPLGLDEGIITYSSGVMDSGVFAKDPYNNSGVLDWPKNYNDTYRNTTIPIYSAVAESTNTVAVRVGEWVGNDVMYDFLTETLQVSSLLNPEDLAPAPLVLGSMTYGMCAYELAGCYMMYGGNETYGIFNSLHSYTKVVDSKGTIVLEPERTTVQAIKPETGYIGNRLLSNVLRARGLPGGATGTAIGMAVEGEMDSVAKTGTTSDDNDRWLVGLTPYYVTAVWWGYDEEHTLYGRWGPGSYNNIPVNVWKSLMETVQADLPVKQFPPEPETIEEIYFCTSSGLRASPGCPAVLTPVSSELVADLAYCPGHAPPPAAEGEGEAPAEAAPPA